MTRAIPGRLLLFAALAGFVALRLAALFGLPLVGDEADDLYILETDFAGIPLFFTAPDGYEFDQARLPFFLSYPILYLTDWESIVALRLFFFVFHLLYAFVSYKLAFELTKNAVAAWAYVLAIAASCYLASFSIFFLTTGDNLFLLFHALSMLLFVRILDRERREGSFCRPVLLSLVVALCIASKLFGVLLLIALFLAHWIHRPAQIVVRSVAPDRLIRIGALWFVLLLGLNLAPIPLFEKGLVAIALSVGYLGVILRMIARERAADLDAVPASFLALWTAIVVTAFDLTLIFSPVYLNLANLLKVFTWFGTWPTGVFVAESHVYDILVIIAMKLGLLSTALLLAVALIRVVWLRGAAVASGLGALFVIVFGVHFVANSVSRFNVTWYPLAIFPLLFLFVVCTWQRSRKLAPERGKRWSVLIGVCFCLMLVDNSVRYLRWHPYGHFDGAQYGTEYIGWNRAGFVTFEAIPDLFEFLTDRAGTQPILVDCKLVEVPLYNEWAAEMLQDYFDYEGVERFRFRDLTGAEADSARLLLTSPVYNPELERRLDAGDADRELERVRTISLKGIDIVTVWEPVSG